MELDAADGVLWRGVDVELVVADGVRVAVGSFLVVDLPIQLVLVHLRREAGDAGGVELVLVASPRPGVARVRGLPWGLVLRVGVEAAAGADVGAGGALDDEEVAAVETDGGES
jgi:hypothetical protein